MSCRYFARLLVLGALALQLGCASHPEPIIDKKGVNMAQYEVDLVDCKTYSDQVRIEKGVAKGAVAGGALGGATGAVVGNSADGAGVGAITGAARSAQIGASEKNQIVYNCLRGRGYRVLKSRG